MNINMILDQYLFEWHHDKDLANQAKHGISFQEAAMLWRDACRIEVETQIINSELRWLTTGIVVQKDSQIKMMTVCFTYRLKSIRIISARSSRDHEREEYEQRKE